MASRIDVTFPVEGGIQLAAWLYLPDGPGRHPAITMSHGFAATRYHSLEQFASAFAAAGFAVLVHEHRGFGASGGEPRQDINPWQQIADWRRAICFLESHPSVDPTRIALWGTSYSGAHSLVMGATDRRVKAVVSQVPMISGYDQGLRWTRPEAVAATEQAHEADERAQFRGEPPQYLSVASADMSIPAAFRTKEALEFCLQPMPEGVWENKVTLRSTRWLRMYDPGHWIARISPTPLLMLIAREDTVTPTDLALAAYEQALEPKKLVLFKGDHFEAYFGRAAEYSSAAVAWLKEQLSPGR